MVHPGLVRPRPVARPAGQRVGIAGPRQRCAARTNGKLSGLPAWPGD